MLGRALPFLLALAPLAAADTLHVPKDFATIQAAVDASADGDTIVVHKGSYTDPVVVSGKHDLLIRGAGAPALDVTNLGVDDALTLTGCTGIEVRGLHVKGALSAGIFVDASSDVRVHHCNVFGMKSGGWPEAAIRVGDSDHVTIEHNTCSFVIIGIRFYSPSAPGAGATDSIISRNVIHDLWHSGIEVYGTGNLVERNVVRQSSSDGIWCDATDTSVIRNKVRDLDAGLTVFGGSGNLLDHNTVHKAGSFGILVGVGASDTRLAYNRVSASGALQSLRLEGSDGTSDHDRVIKPKADGLALTGTGNTVLGLRIVKPAAGGVDLSGAFNTLTDVRVTHAGADGFHVGGDNNTIADCRALHAADDGFHVMGTSNAFTTCKAKGSGSLDKNDGGTANTFTDCDFGTELP